MTPEDLSGIHPVLYHLTVPEALPGILKHGLLPTSSLLSLFEVDETRRTAIERQIRPANITLTHPEHGLAIVTDNRPLSEKALRSCLDDGLSPGDWVMILNQRVFFWPSAATMQALLSARLNRGRPKMVLEFNTLALARRHRIDIELAPINTGATIRKPARRGLGTFTPLARHSYRDWQKLRGGRDAIREVTVVGGVPRASEYLQRHYEITPGRAT